MYTGPDYSHRVSELDVIEDVWDFGTEGSLQWSPVHQSDMFQWQLLAETSGIYSDMDVLFVQPMLIIEQALQEASTLFCVKEKHFPIGFLGSSGENPFFQEVREASVTHAASGANYQAAGIVSVNRVLVTKESQELVKIRGRWHWMPGVFRPGESDVVATLSEAYPQHRMVNLEENVIYPFRDGDLADLYAESGTRRLSPDCLAIHWYGGAPLSQKMNSALTEGTLDEYPCLFTRILKGVLTYESDSLSDSGE
jgi:hypothetical protein